MELRYCEKCGDIIPLNGHEESPALTGHFLCARCQVGAAGDDKAEGNAYDNSILDQTSMNLFSPNTIAMKKQEQDEKEGPPEEDSPREGSGKASGGPSGSAAPAKGARKLQFRCLHCRAVLMVRPVQKTSRMVCPKCQGSLFIDGSGIVSKRAPGTPSGKPAGTPPGPGSARVTATPAPGSVRLPAGAAAEAGVGLKSTASKSAAPPTPAIRAAAAAATPPSPVRVSRPAASVPLPGERMIPPAKPGAPTLEEEPVLPPAREEPPAKPEAKPPLRVARPAPAVTLRKPAAPPPQPVRPPEAEETEFLRTTIPSLGTGTDFLEDDLSQAEDFANLLGKSGLTAKDPAEKAWGGKEKKPRAPGHLRTKVVSSFVRSAVLLRALLLGALISAPFPVAGVLLSVWAQPSPHAASEKWSIPTTVEVGEAVQRGIAILLETPLKWIEKWKH